MNTRIMLADDHVVFRNGLKVLLEKEGEYEVVAEAGDGFETLRILKATDVDMLLLDLSMPGISGIKIAEEILQVKPYIRIIILTMHDDENYLREGFSIGVKGFVLKKSTGKELIRAIRAVMSGKQYIDASMADAVIRTFVSRPDKQNRSRLGKLTERETEVLQLLSLGHTNAEIAQKLNISGRTVETHRSKVMHKLKLSTRADLVRFAIDNGILGL